MKIECVEAAKKAVQLDKGSLQEWHRRTILSLSLNLMKKYKLALKEANLSLKLAPSKMQAKYCVALCQFYLGQYEDAENNAQAILQSREGGIWRKKTENLIKNISRETKKQTRV